MPAGYNFFVSGIPRPQPRPRMTRRGHVYTPKSAAAWKTAVKSAFLIQQNFKVERIITPIRLMVEFRFAMPKRLKSDVMLLHPCKSDLDNLLKSVMDALTETGVWKDDSQVYRITAKKCYTPDKDRVGAKIVIIGE